jgi:hypothetical protein
MNYAKWFRYAFYCGLAFLCLGLTYYLRLFLRGSSFNLVDAFLNLLPSLLLMFIGYRGPSLFEPSSQFPEPVFCPHCNNLTDKTPCTHCGKNVLQPPTKENEKAKIKTNEDNQKMDRGFMRVHARYLVYFLIIVFIIILFWLKVKS